MGYFPIAIIKVDSGALKLIGASSAKLIMLFCPVYANIDYVW